MSYVLKNLFFRNRSTIGLILLNRTPKICNFKFLPTFFHVWNYNLPSILAISPKCLLYDERHFNLVSLYKERDKLKMAIKGIVFV